MRHGKLFVYNLFGMVDVPLAREIIAKIEAMSIGETEGLCLRINSQGGSVPVALALAGYLRSLPCPVVAYNMAHCDSAALLIFAAAHERIAMETASFMFHPPCVHLNGKFTFRELSAELKRLKKDTQCMVDFLAKAMSIDRAQLATWMDMGEWVLSARQALRVGIATTIEPWPRGLGSEKGGCNGKPHPRKNRHSACVPVGKANRSPDATPV